MELLYWNAILFVVFVVVFVVVFIVLVSGVLINMPLFYNMPIIPYFLPYYLLRLFFTYSWSVEIGKCKIWFEMFELDLDVYLVWSKLLDLDFGCCC